MNHLEHSALIVRKGALVRQLIGEAEAARMPERALALYLKARDVAAAVSRAARYQLVLYSKVNCEKDGEKDGGSARVA
jgi:hypothetical protein